MSIETICMGLTLVVFVLVFAMIALVEKLLRERHVANLNFNAFRESCHTECAFKPRNGDKCHYQILTETMRSPVVYDDVLRLAHQSSKGVVLEAHDMRYFEEGFVLGYLESRKAVNGGNLSLTKSKGRTDDGAKGE